MNYFFEVLSKYADFSGRARRKEFWMFTLINTLIGFSLLAINMLLFESTGIRIFAFIYLVYRLFIIIPALAVSVRRLHDINKSGKWFFIILIPLVGALVLLVFYLTEGTNGENQYGEDPKKI